MYYFLNIAFSSEASRYAQENGFAALMEHPELKEDMTVKQFETEAERRKYIAGVNAATGYDAPFYEVIPGEPTEQDLKCKRIMGLLDSMEAVEQALQPRGLQEKEIGWNNDLYTHVMVGYLEQFGEVSDDSSYASELRGENVKYTFEDAETALLVRIGNMIQSIEFGTIVTIG